MAQTNSFSISANQSGTAFRSGANSIFSALASLNSGATAPTVTVGGMLWLNTSNASTHVLNIRNNANNAWVEICSINTGTNAIIPPYYTKAETDTRVNARLATSTYNTDKATFMLKADVVAGATASKGVLRDSLGDVFARLFRSNYANQAPTSFPDGTGIAYRTSTTDNYIRFCDVSTFKTAFALNNVNNTADSAKNVLSATKLTTPRTISGVSFDGTANITLNKSHVGLGNVDNTTDLAKPISTAVRTALNAKINASDAVNTNTANKVVKRDTNGDFAGRNITATRFNMTQAVQDNSATTSSQIMFRNTDNYLRAMSLEKLKEIIGLANIVKVLNNPIVSGNIYLSGSLIDTYGITTIRPGATFQNVIASRKSNTNYTNTTGYSIIVRGSGSRGGGKDSPELDYFLELTGSNIRKIQTGVWEVKAGGVYKTTQSVGAINNISVWDELR